MLVAVPAYQTTICQMLEMRDAEDPPMVAFQPGSIACLESNPAGGWEIVWMLRPELLVEPPPEAGSGEWA